MCFTRLLFRHERVLYENKTVQQIVKVDAHESGKPHGCRYAARLGKGFAPHGRGEKGGRFHSRHFARNQKFSAPCLFALRFHPEGERMKLKHHWRILRAKIGLLFGKPHKHIFWYQWTGKPRDNPCLICGRTFHELGDEIKQQRERGLL